MIWFISGENSQTNLIHLCHYRIFPLFQGRSSNLMRSKCKNNRGMNVAPSIDSECINFNNASLQLKGDHLTHNNRNNRCSVITAEVSVEVVVVIMIVLIVIEVVVILLVEEVVVVAVVVVIVVTFNIASSSSGSSSSMRSSSSTKLFLWIQNWVHQFSSDDINQVATVRSFQFSYRHQVKKREQNWEKHGSIIT